jgi:hypothetical protein
MKNVVLNLPTLAFVVSTRAALGIGIGLLASERLPVAQRRRVGAMLIALGAATTLPAALAVVRGVGRSKRTARNAAVRHDDRLIGATRFPRKGDDY